ncbi:hypothetical protein FOE78_09010 [Microlunatus elymi]|uniref:SH3 domain-containing protein n=1 Tax=Microlunatus elymi TaxID=2596828 RepID=A0A516PXV8_9ACTN|nr:hypothetical protein [Microlunatus elymi]QDP96018.1 hypothetical protein FOE78_09010 [Microlunatus elymi]
MAAASLTTLVSAPAQAVTAAGSHPVCSYHFRVNTNIRGGASTAYPINGVGLRGQTWTSNPLTVKGNWIEGFDAQTGKRGWVVRGGLTGGSCGHQL